MNPVQQLLTDHIGLWTGADAAKKTGRGRASGSAGAVYGIKKLRELILELAVRGKLVPQDANDEPASALLERIENEKARLIRDGKIKKDKPLAAITDDEKLFVLPQGWEWARFSDYATDIATGPFGSMIHQTDYVEGGVPLINPSHMIDDRILPDSAVSVSKAMAKMLDSYVICDGDIVMARRGEVGRIALVTSHEDGWICGTGSFVLRFCDEIFRDYLRVFFRCNSARVYLAGEAVGTTMVNLNHGILKKMPIGVPPIAEQYRIVAKVDELMVLCDQLEAGHTDATDAHEKLVSHLLTTLTGSQDSADFSASWQRIAAHFDMLFTTEASIEALKQTLLQLAVMGKLVPQDPSDEPANALLERIQAEKARLFFEGKIKKNKLLTAIVDDENLFFLPQGWERINLGAIIELISGQHLNPNEYFDSQDFGSIPYITGPADFGNIGPVPVRYTFERRSLSLFDDVLLTVKGSGVGKINTVSQPELAISRQLMAVRPIVVGTKFIEILLLSMAETFQDLSIGIAIPGISREDVLNSIVALPPIAEQDRIVAKVDELMALCDRMKARIVDAAALQRKLADVMVAQAVA
jgi:type I restriction enzyme S subunit